MLFFSRHKTLENITDKTFFIKLDESYKNSQVNLIKETITILYTPHGGSLTVQLF